MLEVKHLRLIAAIDRCGTLSGAAGELNLTPSALSHQLRQLEEKLGTALFERVNNKLVFTAAGREFRDYGNAILGEVARLGERMEELRRTVPADYVHGYSPLEMERLVNQATTVAEFIHYDSFWPEGTTLLEAGCGNGAQTTIIAAANPGVSITAVDISEPSLDRARAAMAERGLSNVSFAAADLRALPYPDGSFDHVFVCFVLEHLSQPAKVLAELGRVLRPGGSITVVEGDHGSTYFYPDSESARRAVEAQVELQRSKGGNANIGRELFHLLSKAGFTGVRVSPRLIYVDPSRPALVDGFIRKTFTAMIEGIADEAVSAGLLPADRMREGIAHLHRVAESEGGSFAYTFFRATGHRVSLVP